MNFINNFACFTEQEESLVKDDTLLHVTCPFVRITNVEENVIIKSIKLGMKDVCLMIFLINTTNTPFTLEHKSTEASSDEAINVSTNSNKVVQPNSFEVLIYTNNSWMIRDINLT